MPKISWSGYEPFGVRYRQSYKSKNPPRYNNTSNHHIKEKPFADYWEETQREGFQKELHGIPDIGFPSGEEIPPATQTPASIPDLDYWLNKLIYVPYLQKEGTDTNGNPQWKRTFIKTNLATEWGKLINLFENFTTSIRIDYERPPDEKDEDKKMDELEDHKDNLDAALGNVDRVLNGLNHNVRKLHQNIIDEIKNLGQNLWNGILRFKNDPGNNKRGDPNLDLLHQQLLQQGDDFKRGMAGIADNMNLLNDQINNLARGDQKYNDNLKELQKDIKKINDILDKTPLQAAKKVSLDDFKKQFDNMIDRVNSIARHIAEMGTDQKVSDFDDAKINGEIRKVGADLKNLQKEIANMSSKIITAQNNIDKNVNAISIDTGLLTNQMDTLKNQMTRIQTQINGLESDHKMYNSIRSPQRVDVLQDINKLQKAQDDTLKLILDITKQLTSVEKLLGKSTREIATGVSAVDTLLADHIKDFGSLNFQENFSTLRGNQTGIQQTMTNINNSVLETNKLIKKQKEYIDKVGRAIDRDFNQWSDYFVQYMNSNMYDPLDQIAKEAETEAGLVRKMYYLLKKEMGAISSDLRNSHASGLNTNQQIVNRFNMLETINNNLNILRNLFNQFVSNVMNKDQNAMQAQQQIINDLIENISQPVNVRNVVDQNLNLDEEMEVKEEIIVDDNDEVGPGPQPPPAPAPAPAPAPVPAPVPPVPEVPPAGQEQKIEEEEEEEDEDIEEERMRQEREEKEAELKEAEEPVNQVLNDFLTPQMQQKPFNERLYHSTGRGKRAKIQDPRWQKYYDNDKKDIFADEIALARFRASIRNFTDQSNTQINNNETILKNIAEKRKGRHDEIEVFLDEIEEESPIQPLLPLPPGKKRRFKSPRAPAFGPGPPELTEQEMAGIIQTPEEQVRPQPGLAERMRIQGEEEEKKLQQEIEEKKKEEEEMEMKEVYKIEDIKDVNKVVTNFQFTSIDQFSSKQNQRKMYNKFVSESTANIKPESLDDQLRTVISKYNEILDAPMMRSDRKAGRINSPEIVGDSVGLNAKQIDFMRLLNIMYHNKILEPSNLKTVNITKWRQFGFRTPQAMKHQLEKWMKEYKDRKDMIRPHDFFRDYIFTRIGDGYGGLRAGASQNLIIINSHALKNMYGNQATFGIMLRLFQFVRLGIDVHPRYAGSFSEFINEFNNPNPKKNKTILIYPKNIKFEPGLNELGLRVGVSPPKT